MLEHLLSLTRDDLRTFFIDHAPALLGALLVLLVGRWLAALGVAG